jgi:rod shape-determining protein MreC
MAAIRTQKEIRQRAPFWLLILLFINFGLMAIDARDNSTRQRAIRVWVQALASPFERATSSAGGASFSLGRRVLNFRSTAAENDQLKQQVENLELELRNSRAAASENEQLRGLLNLRDKSGYDVIVTRVIARDASVWFNTITIGQGSSSGIELNMPVVTGAGIVGRVVALSPWTAQIMLITDEQAAAGAVVGQVVGQLEQSGAQGSVRGLGQRGLIEMKYVPGLEKVEVGDHVLTTGQDGIYPKGLNVGEIVEVKHGTATQAHVIYIRPSARLDQLESVAVLRYHPPPRPALDQSLPNLDKGKK